MRLIIRGKIVDTADMGDALKCAEAYIQSDLFSLEHRPLRAIDSLDKLGEMLANDESFLMDELCACGLSKEQAIDTKKQSLEVLKKEALLLKIKRELSWQAGEIKRISPKENIFEGYMPLGVIGHVTSGNDALLPFFSAVEGLITGNINVIKPATGAGDVAMALAQKLCEIEPYLCPYFYIFPISSAQEELMASMLALCDGVAVWGGAAAAAGIKKLLQPGTRFIEWGHKISFAYFTQGGVNTAALEGLAHDICAGDQQACSSPQIVYLETQSDDELCGFAHKLFLALQKISPQYTLPAIPQNDAAELTSATLLEQMGELMCGKSGKIEKKVLIAEDGSFRVFVGYVTDLSPSPLYRTILVRPIMRPDILGTLRQYRANMQSVALSCNPDEIVPISKLLFKCGVVRIVNCGDMAVGYPGQPHDGVFALAQYVRRVQLENYQFPMGMYSLSEIQANTEAPFKEGTPVIKKQDFKPVTTKTHGYLVVKSGGSSGKPVYAPHTYEDVENTYITAAAGLLSAGLDPQNDICMNLMYAGDLYGGFISIYEAIKKTGTTQLPMCASMELDRVCDEIIRGEVNTLIGMPTYLIRLLSENKDKLKGRISKVFYGGEHFDPAMSEALQKELGIDTIRSFAYGSNELGSMGYTCPYCVGTEHHLFTDTKYMEILKQDSDQPADEGEIGRIVISSVDENLPIMRYEIGDLGRLKTEPCKCGRLAPKFELLGRIGDIFKFATNYVNYSKIKDILEEQFGYCGKLQLVLSYDSISVMTIKVEKVEKNLEDALLTLRKHYPEIEECVRDKTGIVKFLRCADDAFAYSEHGGKIRHIVDERI